MTAGNQHVVRHPDWGWWIRRAWSDRFTSRTNTQAEAIDRWRNIAINQWSELFIHWRNWRIRERNTYWNDPFPPKG